MATFKIRDLMVAIRPGLQTPQRPKPLDECAPDVDSYICVNSCEDTGDCGDSGGCGLNSCDGTCGCTVSGCGCSGGCTHSCGGTCNACTDTCGETVCTGNITRCNCSGQGTCAASVKPPIIANMDPGSLANLKTQLRLAMQQISQRENVLAAAAERNAVVPQTIAQVDALEQKLSEALDELRARRTELQKTADTTDKKSTDQKK